MLGEKEREKKEIKLKPTVGRLLLWSGFQHKTNRPVKWWLAASRQSRSHVKSSPAATSGK